MITWSLRLGTTTKSLADWGAQGVQLNLASLTSDQLTFTAPRAAFDDDELCAFGDECELIRTEDEIAETWFIGTRQLLASQADASSQSQTYLFDGPWRWLAENIFQQPWGVAGLYTDHIILTQTIGQDIKSVLDYAIANGALFQYVTAELTALSAFPPADEITGQFCAEVIRSRLQFAPDAIHWFDYTTTPLPTLHLAQRSSLVAASVRMASYTADTSLPKAKIRSLRPRPDLQVPSVKINGETIETIDDITYMVPSVDIYPPTATGREDGALNATITLQGRTENNIFGEIECQDIITTEDAAGIEWLKQHIHTLRADGITVLDIESIERLDELGVALATTYPRELIDGQIADWMGLNYQTEVFRVKLTYQEIDPSDGATILKLEDGKVFTFEIVTTDAPAGISTYSITESVDLGDPSIIGLAQYLYEALHPLHYDGAIDLEERECTGQISLGNSLNILGSRAEYAAMSALIQQVSYTIDSGITTITFGPPRHLNLSDILTLLQRFRTRRRWTNPDTQETGELSGSGSQLELGKASHNTNAIPGAGITKKLIIKDGSMVIDLDSTEKRIRFSNSGGGVIEIDLDDLAAVGSTDSFLAKFRLTNLCDSNNNVVRAYVLRTDTFP